LIASAEQVLKGLAAGQPHLLAAIPRVIATFSEQTSFNIVSYRLSSPHRSLAMGIQPRLFKSVFGAFEPLQIPEEQFSEFQQKVFDWVANQKEWDIKRDGEKNIENIAEKADWIVYVLTSRTLGSPLEYAARDSFLTSENESGLMAQLLSPVGEEAGLDAATARQWMEAVLATWRDLAEAELPDKLRTELKALKRTVEKGFLL
jgi:hypothetical protein